MEEQEELQESEGRKTRRTWPTELAEHSVQAPQTEVAVMEPATVCASPQQIGYGCLAYSFCGTPNSGSHRVFSLLLRSFSSCWAASASLGMKVCAQGVCPVVLYIAIPWPVDIPEKPVLF